jgi:hypothetical protein
LADPAILPDPQSIGVRAASVATDDVGSAADVAEA